jgi:DNA-binding HxlR family transcriptional regulator
MQVTREAWKAGGSAHGREAVPTKMSGKGRAAISPRTGARRSACPVACTLDVVGDRWTLLVIRDLLGGKKRYGDFLASSEKIPTNILADRLKRLEREGLIRGVPYSEHPPRVEYHLTPKGRELGRAVEALADWGLSHLPGTARNVRPVSGEAAPEPQGAAWQKS